MPAPRPPRTRSGTRKVTVPATGRPAGPAHPLADALLEIAFHRASKAAGSGDSSLNRRRSQAHRKVARSAAVLLRQLRQAEGPLHRLEDLTAFSRALLEDRYGPGGIERSLLRVHRAQERLLGFRTEEEKRLARADAPYAFGGSVRRFYGRAASVLFEVERDLARLKEAQELLSDRPGLSGALPALPVVGFPNVGKSSLVTRLTRARLRVAPYPFTTLSTAAGHLALRPGVQTPLVDTPGLREAEGRSSHAAEREALLALEHAGPVALFLFDPSGRCGWPMEEQETLLTRLKERFPARRFVEVENKADLLRTPTGRRKISCETGEGLPELVEELRSIFREMGADRLPPLPPLRETLDEPPGQDRDLATNPRHGSG